jgi:hypothetical protein
MTSSLRRNGCAIRRLRKSPACLIEVQTALKILRNALDADLADGAQRTILTFSVIDVSTFEIAGPVVIAEAK